MHIRNLVVAISLVTALALPSSGFAFWSPEDNPCPPHMLCEDGGTTTEPATTDTDKKADKDKDKKETEPVTVSAGIWIPHLTSPKECSNCWGGSITVKF